MPYNTLTMEIVIKPQSKKNLPFKELWEFRELLYFLAWRDIKVRYKQTFIGILWAILQPFLTMIVFTFFFNKVIGVNSGNIPYPVFVFTGLLFWNYFSTSLQDVSNSLIANQSIITKVFFPRIIIPISTTIVPVVDFFFAFLLLIGILFYFHIPFFSWEILFIVPALFFSMVTAVGFGSFLAILNVKYRDVRYALPFFIQLLLFVTPVIYSFHQVSAQLQLFLYLNPLTGVIEAARVVLLHQHTFNIVGICISIITSILLLLVGIAFFMQYERGIADSL
jgi:lipopolysaccharide transport system permease protein